MFFHYIVIGVNIRWWTMVKSQTIDLVEFMGDDPYKDQAMTYLELNEYLNYKYLREEVAGDDLKYISTIYYDIFTYDIEVGVSVCSQPLQL